jgi:hypothetical protein
LNAANFYDDDNCQGAVAFKELPTTASVCPIAKIPGFNAASLAQH